MTETKTSDSKIFETVMTIIATIGILLAVTGISLLLFKVISG